MATRGPRTPLERATDAARSAATLLEDVPPSTDKENWLEPVALLLRYHFGSASQRREEAAQTAFQGLLERLRSSYFAQIHGRDGTNTELLGELWDLLEELRRRLANYVDAAPSSPEAADEGLALTVKLDRLLKDALYAQRGMGAVRRELERIAIGHV